MRQALALLALIATPALADPVEERSIDQLAAAMASGQATSEAITRAYLARIAAMDRTGPDLHAVIATNPDAPAEARAADARRRAGHALGPLDGIPLLIKDNIETLDPMPTTAGSLALAANLTRRDAPVVARLRAAGVVILGKSNLSEWANIRSNHSVSGWSAVGGQARNPYALDRTPCGSSSGSGAGVAASLAAAALGTETDGSVVCPSAMNGLVGLKPTLGLVSRSRVVPISHSQDTPGPMARSVRDVALLLTAMAGSDPADPDTAPADAHRSDYAAALDAHALRGKRVAVLRPKGLHPLLAAQYARALAALAGAGAVLVDVEPPKLDGLGEAENAVLMTELKADLGTYLAATPPAVTSRSLADVIAFDTAHGEEMKLFGQESFIAAQATRGLDDPEYLGLRAKSRRLAGAEGIDAMLAAAKADILVEPTYGPAWLIEPVYGDQYDGPSASELPAIAGYPHLTVPMGLAMGLPVGISFIGRKWGEAGLLAAGYAYEQASHARVAPTYAAT